MPTKYYTPFLCNARSRCWALRIIADFWPSIRLKRRSGPSSDKNCIVTLSPYVSLTHTTYVPSKSRFALALLIRGHLRRFSRSMLSDPLKVAGRTLRTRQRGEAATSSRGETVTIVGLFPLPGTYEQALNILNAEVVIVLKSPGCVGDACLAFTRGERT